MNRSSHGPAGLSRFIWFFSAILLFSAAYAQAQTLTITSSPFNASTSSSDNASAIQAAINAVGSGGTVVVPSGTFLSGPLTLKSNMTFQIAAGGELEMTAMGTFPQNTDFLFGSGLTNITINGSGVMEGQGQAWWTAFNNGGTDNRPPAMIELTGCSGATVTGITVQNSPKFHIQFLGNGTNILAQGLSITAPWPSPNTDGIDLRGTNVNIKNCFISDGDDVVQIGGSNACSGITVTGCTFGNGHGLSIGSITKGNVSNVLVDSCIFNGTQYGLRLKSNNTEGGVTSNITYSNITMTNIMKNPILMFSYYPTVPSSPATDTGSSVNSTTPFWENIKFQNVTASEATTGNSNVGILWGLPQAPVSNVLFDACTLTGSGIMEVFNTQGVTFDCNNLINGKAPSNTAAVTTFNISAAGPDDVQFPSCGSNPTPTKTNTPLPPTATHTNTPVPPTATFTFTATHTNTPVPPTATFTFTATKTNTPVPPTATFTAVPPTATLTFTPTKTNTPVPPTATFTAVPPTATFTFTFTRTNTPVPPTATLTFTATKTNTPVPPTATNTPVPPTATNTAVPPTATLTFTSTNTLTATLSSTATRTNTPVPPTATFTAVPPTATNTAAPPTATDTPVPPTATNTAVPPTATRTVTPTNSATATLTNTPVPPTSTLTAVPPTATNTSVPPTATFTNSPVPPTATNTPVPPTATNTAIPPTATLTNTPVPPTSTFTAVPPTATHTSVPPTATNTLVPPTATRTNTPVPPTATFTAVPPTATLTFTPTKTNTPVPPTATFTPVPPTPTLTHTPVPPTATPGAGIHGVVFPNPVSGNTVQVQVSGLTDTTKVSLEIFSLSMRKISEQDFHSQGPGTVTLTLLLKDASGASLANGVYYVEVRADNQRLTLKLMVLH